MSRYSTVINTVYPNSIFTSNCDVYTLEKNILEWDRNTNQINKYMYLYKQNQQGNSLIYHWLGQSSHLYINDIVSLYTYYEHLWDDF